MFFFYFGRFSKQMCQITFSTLGLKVEDSEMEHIIEETTKVKKFLRLSQLSSIKLVVFNSWK